MILCAPSLLLNELRESFYFILVCSPWLQILQDICDMNLTSILMTYGWTSCWLIRQIMCNMQKLSNEKMSYKSFYAHFNPPIWWFA